MIFAGGYPDFGAPRMTPAERAASIEKRRLLVLEPSTQKFVAEILTWCRAVGIPAVLGETARTKAAQAAAARAGKTAIAEGQSGWHQFGRAFHLVILRPGTNQLDRAAYARVGAEVRRRGGDWLGDRPLSIRGKLVEDLAHFEYHPGLSLGTYRQTAAAQQALALADKRIARYGVG